MARQIRRWRVAVLLLAPVVLTGCPADIRVAIEEDSTLSSLTFAVSTGSRERPTALPMFLVESCTSIFFGARDEFWMLEAGDDPEEVRRLHYGVRPRGYREAHPARALESDACYAVTFGGADELYFVADPGGDLSVVTQDEAKQLATK